MSTTKPKYFCFFITVSPKTRMTDSTLKRYKDYTQKCFPTKYIFKEEYGSEGNHHHLHILGWYPDEKRTDQVSRNWKDKFPFEKYHPDSDIKILWRIEAAKTPESCIYKYYINKDPAKHNEKDKITMIKGIDLEHIKKKYEALNPIGLQYRKGILIKDKDAPFFYEAYILKYHKDELSEIQYTTQLCRLIDACSEELLIKGYATHLIKDVHLWKSLKILLKKYLIKYYTNQCRDDIEEVHANPTPPISTNVIKS